MVLPAQCLRIYTIDRAVGQRLLNGDDDALFQNNTIFKKSISGLSYRSAGYVDRSAILHVNAIIWIVVPGIPDDEATLQAECAAAVHVDAGAHPGLIARDAAAHQGKRAAILHGHATITAVAAGDDAAGDDAAGDDAALRGNRIIRVRLRWGAVHHRQIAKYVDDVAVIFMS